MDNGMKRVGENNGGNDRVAGVQMVWRTACTVCVFRLGALDIAHVA